MKPKCQEGILNPGGGEGTWGTTGGREQVWGPGLGSLLTMLPWFPRYPNLACTNEATPRGESPEAIRPEPDGHPAEKPTATRPRLRGHDRARTRSHTRGLHSDVTHTSRMPYRTGWERGTLVYLLPAGPGCRPWARKPGRKKKKSRRRRTTEEDDNKRGTFCHRYVSVHSDVSMFPDDYADF